MKKIRNILIIITLIGIISGFIFVKNGYEMYKKALEEIPLSEKVTSIKEKENYTEIGKIPEMYKNAVISVEDHRFYKHNGIDIIAIGRALVNDVKAMDFVEGGSTITQQLCKNIYFTQENLHSQ